MQVETLLVVMMFATAHDASFAPSRKVEVEAGNRNLPEWQTAPVEAKRIEHEAWAYRSIASSQTRRSPANAGRKNATAGAQLPRSSEDSHGFARHDS